ncbi:DUF1501 domain-containing protein [Tautonia plasticadhaerens]|uniref:DUF1501 domain-containing protein n=1 Tax=Tautonia plasticadhaerens TaxID=2527974 RepID=A0A518H5G4_9BACT|nr:DUF1501 domain-containing protein [Tautonia plasticadhaerens]QDV36072.1 hypothetical protein ElP_39820 [Tautonia plasticadhaerens]
MWCPYSCRSAEHAISRRSFLGGVSAGLGAVSGFAGRPMTSLAGELGRQGSQVLMVFLHGGSSQLETWDPKPGTATGGPFRSIETSIPGVRISELLPKTAQQMHHLSLLRSLNTAEDDHGKGSYLMHTGRRQAPGQEHPHLGSLAARFLAPERDPLPGYIHVTAGGGGLSGKDAAFLGPKYGALTLGDGKPPANTERPGSVEEAEDLARHQLRMQLDHRFDLRRRTAETEAYTTSYEQALQLMERREVFDVSKEPARDQERYGSHDFGRHCLLGRRLLEAGATFVKVSHSNYDTHNENFDFHLEQVGEFDVSFAALLSDLADRGMLDRTLVVVMSEFGRTPRINQYYGRDHWSTAWSVALTGAGLKRGVVRGETNADGTEVVDGQATGQDLFHTYLRAVGIDPVVDEFAVNGRDFQIADPASFAIEDLLA